VNINLGSLSSTFSEGTVDIAAEQADSFNSADDSTTFVVDDTDPTVTDVTAVSGEYSQGETVDITVQFSEDINYDNNDGSNDVVLEIKDLGSGSTKTATHKSTNSDNIISNTQSRMETTRT
jgi:hypothetical protein